MCSTTRSWRSCTTSTVISYARASNQPCRNLYNLMLIQTQGPREVSILRKSAVPLLYGPNSECTKATVYGQNGNDPKKCSIHATRDFNDHRLRRRAWDRGFSI